MADQRAQSAPPLKLAEPAKAHQKTVAMPPSFTMRSKTSFGDMDRYRNRGGEIPGDLSKKVDAIKDKPPAWSMRPRASGIPPPPNMPGPGEYKMPSTIHGSHPTLTQPGRVPNLTSKRDGSMEAPAGDTPSPQDYEVVRPGKFGRVDQTAPPQYSIRTKLKDPTSKEKRPGVQTYTIGKNSRNGPITAPQWTMMARASGIPPPPTVPGPGEYKMPSTIHGSHPTLTQPGRVPNLTSKRDGSMESPAGDTPSPQDYEVVRPGKFGRVDQTAPPQYSIRTKLKDPTSKEKRPGVQTYTIGKNSRNGAITAPQWTMMARASGIPPPPKVPGPGEYRMPSTIYGSHPTLNQPGRVPKTTSDRFPKTVVDSRPY